MGRKPAGIGRRLTAAAAALLFGAAIAGAAAGTAEPIDLVQIEAWYRAGEFDAMHRACVAGLEQHRDDPLLLRLKGVAEMELGRPLAAVETLRHALAGHPDSIAVRYYLAQAQAYAGDLHASAQLLETIVQRAPESAYAAQARRILPELTQRTALAEAMPALRRWNLYLNVSADHDDNVPARADDDADEGPTASWRWTASIYGEFRLLDEAPGRAPFTLGLGYSLVHTWHEEAAFEAFDVQSHRAGAFLEKRGAIVRRAHSLRLAGHYALTEVGDEPHSEAVEADAEWRLWWSQRTLLVLHGSWETRRDEREAAFPEYYSRDGEEWQTGIRLQGFLPGDRLRVGLSYAYRESRTEGAQFRLHSHQGGVSLAATLPLGLYLAAAANYAERDYVEFLPEPRRIDRVWTGNASLSRAFFGDRLQARVGYTAVQSGSTRDFAAYARNIVSLGLNLAL